MSLWLKSFLLKLVSLQTGSLIVTLPVYLHAFSISHLVLFCLFEGSWAAVTEHWFVEPFFFQGCCYLFIFFNLILVTICNGDNFRDNRSCETLTDNWAKHKIKFGSKWPNHFWEKPILIFKCKWPWVKVKKWPWPSILTYLHYLNWFQVTGCKSSEKSTVFTFSYR